MTAYDPDRVEGVGYRDREVLALVHEIRDEARLLIQQFWSDLVKVADAAWDNCGLSPDQIRELIGEVDHATD